MRNSCVVDDAGADKVSALWTSALDRSAIKKQLRSFFFRARDITGDSLESGFADNRTHVLAGHDLRHLLFNALDDVIDIAYCDQYAGGHTALSAAACY